MWFRTPPRAVPRSGRPRPGAGGAGTFRNRSAGASAGARQGLEGARRTAGGGTPRVVLGPRPVERVGGFDRVQRAQSIRTPFVRLNVELVQKAALFLYQTW